VVLQVWDVTKKMLGKKRNPSFKGKASETHGLLLFAVGLLEDNMVFFLGAKGDIPLRSMFLMHAGHAALHLDGLFQSSERNLNWSSRQQMLDLFLRFSHLYVRGGGQLVPKFHAMIHLLQWAHIHGNPKYYHTYRDESLNGLIAKIGKSCHFRSFQAVSHYKFSIRQSMGLTMDVH
jgi:hypothetical protein